MTDITKTHPSLKGKIISFYDIQDAKANDFYEDDWFDGEDEHVIPDKFVRCSHIKQTQIDKAVVKKVISEFINGLENIKYLGPLNKLSDDVNIKIDKTFTMYGIPLEEWFEEELGLE